MIPGSQQQHLSLSSKAIYHGWYKDIVAPLGHEVSEDWTAASVMPYNSTGAKDIRGLEWPYHEGCSAAAQEGPLEERRRQMPDTTTLAAAAYSCAPSRTPQICR
jgi:hypothetical protein